MFLSLRIMYEIIIGYNIKFTRIVSPQQGLQWVGLFHWRIAASVRSIVAPE